MKSRSHSNSNLILLLTAAVVIIAGVYFWRKKAENSMKCQEICYSTSPENSEGCDVICTPPASAAE